MEKIDAMTHALKAVIASGACDVKTAIGALERVRYELCEIALQTTGVREAIEDYKLDIHGKVQRK